MKPDDLAFPFLPTQDRHANTSGISLRTYLAAKAMQAIISKSPFLDSSAGHFDPTVYGVVAASACVYADALLAELNK